MEFNYIQGLHALLQQLIDQGRMPIPDVVQKALGDSRAQLRQVMRAAESEVAVRSASTNNESDVIALCNEGISKSRLINSFEWEILFKKLKKAVLAQQAHIS
ncbi:MAG: hypothetical protein PHV93_04530 [Candidatus Pacebacteria bacterium]|nr:hypothetical protein [Candidatus Paceibacterota bacterium]